MVPTPEPKCATGAARESGHKIAENVSGMHQTHLARLDWDLAAFTEIKARAALLASGRNERRKKINKHTLSHGLVKVKRVKRNNLHRGNSIAAVLMLSCHRAKLVAEVVI